jgi:hypothetical protein
VNEHNEQIENQCPAIVRRGTVFMAYYVGKPKPFKVQSVDGNFAKCISCDLKHVGEFRVSRIIKSLEDWKSKRNEN